jgi:hypothetical protein
VWFLFGIVTTLGFAAYFAYRRLVEPWSGEPFTRDGSRAEYKIYKNKGRITKLRIGVAAPDQHDFTLRRQRGLDAFFVRIGLSHEQTVGDVVFDDSMYLLSDDARLGLRLRGDLQLRDALFGLIQEDSRVRVVRVRCVGGRLWVECKPTEGFLDALVPAALEPLVPRLQQAAERLAARPPIGALPGDRSLVKSVILLAASSALALNGAVHLARASIMRPLVKVVELGELIALAFTVGLGLLAVLVALVLVLLRKSSRAHGVLLEVLLTGSFGCVATSYVELYELNLEADTAPAVPLRLELTGRESYRCGKRNRSTCYRVRIAGPELPEQTLKVDHAKFRALSDAHHVQVTLHAGALGMRWIEGLDEVD